MRPTLGMEKLLKNYLVQQLPLSRGLVIEKGTPLKAVLFSMRDQKTGCAMIVEKGALIGIFTEHDFLKIVISDHSWDQPIEMFASKKPWTTQPEMPVRDAIALMKDKKIRHLPVVKDEGQFLGVISIRNVIKLFAEHFPADVMNLPPRLHKNPITQEGG